MKLLAGLLIGLLLGWIISAVALNKHESPSHDAASVVGYGYNGTDILPFQVTVDGKLITN